MPCHRATVTRMSRMTDLDRLLDFAERSRLPEGGFGYLGDDGAVLADRPVETWIVARMTHVFGLAHLLGRPGADDLVRHGVAALTEGPLHDAEHGGWRASTDDDTKTAYVHAFVAARRLDGDHGRGRRRPRSCSHEALAVWQTRFWDDDAGLAVEEWDRAWSGSTTTAASTPTCTASRRRWPRPTRCAGRPRGRRRRLRAPGAAQHRAGGARLGAASGTGGCPSTSPPTGSRCPTTTGTGRPTRSGRTASPSGTSSSGRGCACTSARSLAEPPDWLLADAVALFDAAAARGWAADGHDGFPYTLDWDDRPVVGARMHWVLCEAVAGGDRAGRGHRGASATGRRRRQWREHGEQPFADPATGSWHHELTPDRRGRHRAPGPASPTPTTWPRCCCSTAARCAAASRPRCADAARSAGAGRLHQHLAAGAAGDLQGHHRADVRGVELQLRRPPAPAGSMSRVSSASVYRPVGTSTCSATDRTTASSSASSARYSCR